MHAAKKIVGSFSSLSLVALIVAFGATPPRASAEEGIAGDWEVKMDRDGRLSYASLTISKNADGTFAGKWGRTDLSEVKFDGQKLTFVRVMKFGDQEFRQS